MAVVEVRGVSYHIDDRLKTIWDKLRDGKLIKNDEDRVYIVDGRERSGKSLFAIQQAAYLDPTFDLHRICFTPDELLKQIKEAPQGSVIIFDEAFRGLSSARSRSNTNQQIKTALMEMGQRNLILFIVLPSFFLLDMYAAILRSHALFHIQKDEGSKQRSFRVYNEKKKWYLFHLGVKRGADYGKPFTSFKGRYSNKYPINEIAYRAKKARALSNFTTPEVEVDNPFVLKYHKTVYALREELKLSEDGAAKLLNRYGVEVAPSNIGIISRKMRENAQPIAPNI